MADQPDQPSAERERVREHYRAVLARLAEIAPEVRDAEQRTVREAAAARRRSAA